MLSNRHENPTLDFGYFQVIFEYFRTKSLDKRWKKNTCGSPRLIFEIPLTIITKRSILDVAAALDPSLNTSTTLLKVRSSQPKITLRKSFLENFTKFPKRYL